MPHAMLSQLGGDGIFYHNSSIRFTDIRDGLTNTIVVGERNSSLDFSTWVGVVHGVKQAIPRIVGSTDLPPNDKAGEFEHFSSRHPGCSVFLYADGSVRSIYDTIDPQVFHALGTRDGREAVETTD